jgi:hypothetical protein
MNLLFYIEGAGRFVADVLSWRDITNEDSTTRRDYPTGVLIRYSLRSDSGYWHIFIHRDKKSILFVFDGDITEAIRYIKQNGDRDGGNSTTESSFSGRFYGQRTSYEFRGNDFSGYFNTTRIFWGTFTVSGNKINMHITGGVDGETSQSVTFTIIDTNTIADKDGTLYRRR